MWCRGGRLWCKTQIEGRLLAPRREKGKLLASPVPPAILGKSRRVGPETMSEVATVNMTLSPITDLLPKTQKTSYSSRPASITAPVLKLFKPNSCRQQAQVMTSVEYIIKEKREERGGGGLDLYIASPSNVKTERPKHVLQHPEERQPF